MDKGLYKREKKLITQMSKSGDAAGALQGIKGWLLFFAITLLLSILYNLYGIYRFVNIVVSYNVSLNLGVCIFIFISAAAVILQILAIIHLLKGNILFRLLYVCAVAIILATNIFTFLQMRESISVPQLVVSTVVMGIWIFYLFLSRRVKVNFHAEKKYRKGSGITNG